MCCAYVCSRFTDLIVSVETQISKSLMEILDCICQKSTQVKHFPFHLCRPWMAFSSWLTWRATSCLCLRMWPSTCITTRRSSWTPVSTACCMLEIMLSSSRTSYQSPSVSQRPIFTPNLYFIFWFFLLFAALVCHTFPVFFHVASSLCFWSHLPSSP